MQLFSTSVRLFLSRNVISRTVYPRSRFQSRATSVDVIYSSARQAIHFWNKKQYLIPLTSKTTETYFSFSQKGRGESLEYIDQQQKLMLIFQREVSIRKMFCFDKVQTSFYRLHRLRAWLNNCKDCLVSNVKKWAFGSVI